jgi:putative phosphonate metabolism protein
MVKPTRAKHRAKEEKRYAIYYAPEDGSSLDTFGQTWLGRDVRSSNSLEQPRVEGISSQKLKDIVSAAAHYGFHGTLKPPFYLKRPDLERHLFEDIALFALKQSPFYLPKLCLAQLGGFLALIPETPCPDVNRLADQCVRQFDSYRRTASVAELNRRRATGLTASQEHYLRKWGYPYVMNEFRFHLTLSGTISNPILAEHIKKGLENHLSRVELDSIRVESICIFIQNQVDKPFLLHSRYSLGRLPNF